MKKLFIVICELDDLSVKLLTDKGCTPTGCTQVFTDKKSAIKCAQNWADASLGVATIMGPGFNQTYRSDLQ